MEDDNSIHASKVCVEKDHTQILNELNFTVKAGSVTGLIGPSGSGKTTLIRAIAGVQSISSGTLAVLGKSAGVKQLRRKVGYMAQTPAIYSDLTVTQNIAYFAKLLDVDKRQVASRIAAVNLQSQEHQLVEKLSGGQKIRVSLAIALLGNPDVLVLDEPTVGLDPVLRRDLWQLFAHLAAQGKTLIISSHVMDEAERCDTVLLLRDGRLLWNDSRESLLASTHTTTVESAFLCMIDEKEKH
jgi:ABC-2 type transport system ATP-binding protein